MADPFTDIVETLAPSRPTTSFFSDPTGANVITQRWAAGRELEASRGVAETANRLEQSRIERADRMRKDLLSDRMDREYEERQNARAMRGELMLKMPEVLDYKKPTFLDDMSRFLANNPPEVAEDPVIKDQLAALTERHRAFNIEKRMDVAARRRIQLDKDAGLVPKEEYDAIPIDPETGEKDAVELARAIGRNEAAQRIREQEAASTRRVEEAKQKEIFKAEMKSKLTPAGSLSKEQKASRDMAIKNIEVDPAAFRRPMDNLVKQWQSKKKLPRQPTEEDLRKEFPDTEVTYAKEWKPETELRLAKEFATVDDYVAAGGEQLTPRQKELRAQVWQIANGEGQFEAPAAAPTAAPSERPQIQLTKGVRYKMSDGTTRVLKDIVDGKPVWDK